MARRLVAPDVAVIELARNLFEELNRGYVALGQFRGRLAMEIQSAAPEPLRKPLQDVDRLISAAQDQLDTAVKEIRSMAPGTFFPGAGASRVISRRR